MKMCGLPWRPLAMPFRKMQPLRLSDCIPHGDLLRPTAQSVSVSDMIPDISKHHVALVCLCVDLCLEILQTSNCEHRQLIRTVTAVHMEGRVVGSCPNIKKQHSHPNHIRCVPPRRIFIGPNWQHFVLQEINLIIRVPPTWNIPC